MGIVKLVSTPARLRVKKRLAEYDRTKPAQVEVSVGNHMAEMLVADAAEYSRVLSFQDDRKILQALISNLDQGECYWDIGSSIGLYAVLMAKAVGSQGKVIAFEPESRSFRRLLQNIEANQLPNIRPFKLALGSARQTLKLNVSEQACSGTHSLVFSNPADQVAYEEVEVVPGDEFRQAELLPVPAALKIDVEGAEEDVLVGLIETLRQPECRTLICEVHFAILEASGRGQVPKRIPEFLKTCGFSRFQWLDHSHLAAYK
jgi:FkbM family methyltransferase